MWAIKLLLVATVLCAGCGRTWSITYHPGDAGRLAKAPASGQYDLYANNAYDRVCSVALVQGESVGFEHDGNERLTAIAGPERWTIAEGTYRWKRPGIPKTRSEDWRPDTSTISRITLRDIMEGTVVVAAMIVVYGAEGVLLNALDDCSTSSREDREYHPHHTRSHNSGPTSRP